MAVQAQYPSNAFAADFRTRARNNLLEEFQFQIQNQTPTRNHFTAYNNLGAPQPQQILNGTVFSDPESELTCIASGTRKRSRDDQVSMAMTPQIPQQQCLRYANLNKTVGAAAGNDISYDQSRMSESGTTSTSGRPPAHASPFAQDLASHLYQQNLEIDALIRLQNERLRSGLEEARKRHCKILLLTLEQQVMKRLKERETELENANRRNVELEEKVKQMTAENQIWFNVARNNEAIVSSLRSTLEQVLQGGYLAAAAAAPPAAKEGYGDSGDAAIPFAAVADEAQSCCFEGGEKEEMRKAEEAMRENRELRCRKACKVCVENDVSVLLLPCRHLCLCKDCESKLDTCPICHVTKNASLHVYLS